MFSSFKFSALFNQIIDKIYTFFAKFLFEYDLLKKLSQPAFAQVVKYMVFCRILGIELYLTFSLTSLCM